MEYVVRVDRPLIDNEVMEIVVGSKAEAAEGIAFMIMMESLLPGFELISREMTEDTLTVKLSTGTIIAYPKVDKKRAN